MIILATQLSQIGSQAVMGFILFLHIDNSYQLSCFTNLQLFPIGVFLQLSSTCKEVFQTNKVAFLALPLPTTPNLENKNNKTLDYSDNQVFLLNPRDFFCIDTKKGEITIH